MGGGWVWRSRVRNETILSSRGREADGGGGRLQPSPSIDLASTRRDAAAAEGARRNETKRWGREWHTGADAARRVAQWGAECRAILRGLPADKVKLTKMTRRHLLPGFACASCNAFRKHVKAPALRFV